MAQIIVNELSANYSYSVGNASYATVAIPITSSWGPGFFDPAAYSISAEDMLEKTAWQRFRATQEGVDSFVSTFRGPTTYYRMVNDYSYQQAMTLLASGYDILACRICPGAVARGELIQQDSNKKNTGVIQLSAKYPGSFGNRIQVVAQKSSYFDRSAGAANQYKKWYWTFVTYIIDDSGVRTAVENISLVFNINNETDSIPFYAEAESGFWKIDAVLGSIAESADATELGAVDPSTDSWQTYVTLGTSYLHSGSAVPSTGAETNKVANPNVGTDYDKNTAITADKLQNIIETRFKWAADYAVNSQVDNVYASDVSGAVALPTFNAELAKMLYAREWVITKFVECGSYAKGSEDFPGGSTSFIGGVADILKDKLSYNPQRVVCTWEDQYYSLYGRSLPDSIANANTCRMSLSSTHLKLMDVAYYSRCATGYIDVPKLLPRKLVHIEDAIDPSRAGYIQILARIIPANSTFDTNASLFHTHCGFFAPWGQYTYIGSSKMTEAPPAFLALLIQRAQILNQSVQYEWALPTNRKHSLRIGKMDYSVPKKVLDAWQKTEGSSVNVITTIPDLGINVWGNSTTYEVPPATYQALANLSTRFLVNAVEDVVYRCGIAVTFQYNNSQAYSSMHAGVTPILDTMKNVGAIESYRVKFAADINGDDRVNANTIVGYIYLSINGVVNDIVVDLVALPPNADLNAFA